MSTIPKILQAGRHALVLGAECFLRWVFIPASDLLHTLFFDPRDHPRPDSNLFHWLLPVAEGCGGGRLPQDESPLEPGASFLKAYVGNCDVRLGRVP